MGLWDLGEGKHGYRAQNGGTIAALIRCFNGVREFCASESGDFVKRSLFVMMLGLAVITPALAVTLSEKTGVNGMLGVAPRTEDFVSEVAISDMFEIQSGEIAQIKGDAQEKALAKQMIADHQRTRGELRALVENVKVVIPSGLDRAHQAMIDALNRLDGIGFDKLYGSDQLSSHKAAISLFERYAKGGENPALKDWAIRTIPMLRQHLDMARALRINVTG